MAVRIMYIMVNLECAAEAQSLHLPAKTESVGAYVLQT